MDIRLEQASRTFGAQVVFKDLDLNLPSGIRLAILGANGSGKSTFLKCLYGSLSLSRGQIHYQIAGQNLNPMQAARRMGYSAPYLELIEELPALELLETLARFRPWRDNWNSRRILEACLLEEAKNKRVVDFSSGMKQRLRLGIALSSQSDLIILDEPSSNLDQSGQDWFQDFLGRELGDRTLLVGTNFSGTEAFLCDQEIQISDYQ